MADDRARQGVAARAAQPGAQQGSARGRVARGARAQLAHAARRARRVAAHARPAAARLSRHARSAGRPRRPPRVRRRRAAADVVALPDRHAGAGAPRLAGGGVAAHARRAERHDALAGRRGDARLRRRGIASTSRSDSRRWRSARATDLRGQPAWLRVDAALGARARAPVLQLPRSRGVQGEPPADALGAGVRDRTGGSHHAGDAARRGRGVQPRCAGAARRAGAGRRRRATSCAVPDGGSGRSSGDSRAE